MNDGTNKTRAPRDKTHREAAAVAPRPALARPEATGQWWRYLVAALVGVSVLVLALGSDAATRSADAQPACTTSTPTVSTAAGLDDAIDCYNAQTPAGDHTITFGADITHATGTPVITQGDTDHSLTIEGAGHALIGPGDIPGRFYLITHDGPALLTINELTLTETDRRAIYVQAGVVVITNSTVGPNPEVGLWVTGGKVLVSQSTFSDNVGRSVFVESTGSVVISNSTLHDTSSVFGGVGTSIEVTSSSIGGVCLSFGTFVDGLNNITQHGDCAPLRFTQGSLAAGLADNGGPTPTVALLRGSNAVGIGRCANVPVSLNPAGDVVLGDLEFDQRGPGFPRENNIGCDAGAFEVECDNPFVDVPGSTFYTEPVIWAACNGVTTGKTATTFAPRDPLTRGEMATFLWRYAGRPDGSPDHAFTDVPGGTFFSEPVKWLVDQDITTGTGDGTTFSPNDGVTRAQMAAFIWRYVGEPDAGPGSAVFTDIPAGSYYDIATGWMASTGVTTGTGNGTYSPGAVLTRAQAVTFLHRLLIYERSN